MAEMGYAYDLTQCLTPLYDRLVYNRPLVMDTTCSIEEEV